MKNNEDTREYRKPKKSEIIHTEAIYKDKKAIGKGKQTPPIALEPPKKAPVKRMGKQQSG